MTKRYLLIAVGLIFWGAAPISVAWAQDSCTCERCPLAEFEARIGVASTGASCDLGLERLPPVPEDFTPWWRDPLSQPLCADANAAPIDLETLILKTLEHSAQVKVFSDLPLIRNTAIIEADAAFDWRTFLQSRWDDISDPVGNDLTTGGPDHFRDHFWTSSGGLRKQTVYGGQLEMSQRFGHQDNNSRFFNPPNQGTARLNLSYTQPLLRGAGKVYNTSLIVLAQIDAEIACQEFSRQLQSHLLEVTRAYWGLYLERAAWLQKRRLYERSQKILQELEARRGVDAVASQIVRVRAAVTERRGELIRAEMAVRNAQDRIHALVNDPELALIEKLELIPLDQPTRIEIPVYADQSLSLALQQRPEVNQALKQIKAASVRLNMSCNELLPQLDVVVQTYLAGLQGRSDIPGAWLDQFRRGEPSYGIGLIYEVPFRRRADRARLERRRLELRQLQNQFRATVETLMLEVKVAVREVQTSFREASAKHAAMQAAENQLDYIEQRWRRLPGEEKSINLYLEDVLAAQQRLAAAEFGFLQAETTYNLALMNLKRATGTLLQDEQINHTVACRDCLPTMMLEKQLTGDELLPPGTQILPTTTETRSKADGLPVLNQTPLNGTGLIDAHAVPAP